MHPPAGPLAALTQQYPQFLSTAINFLNLKLGINYGVLDVTNRQATGISLAQASGFLGLI